MLINRSFCQQWVVQCLLTGHSAVGGLLLIDRSSCQQSVIYYVSQHEFEITRQVKNNVRLSCTCYRPDENAVDIFFDVSFQNAEVIAHGLPQLSIKQNNVNDFHSHV